MQTRQQRTLWAMVMVLAVAFGLRVWLIADTNFNWDEGYSMWMSRQAPAQLFDSTARDVHPPLYYLALKTTRAALGDGELSARFLSVGAGVLTVALAFQIGRAVGGDVAGVVAALLMALSRGNIHIAQLARMHALAALFSALGVWAALTVWRTPRRRDGWAALVVGLTGALYTFYLTVMLPLALNIAFVWVWMRRRSWRLLFGWIGAQALAAGVFAGWAIYARSRMFGWNSDTATPPGFFTKFYATTLTLGRPTYDSGQVSYALAYLAVMALGGVVILWRERDRSRGGVPLLLAGIITPAAVVFVLALPFHELGRPLAARYMLPLSVTFYALAGWSAAALWRWRRIVGAVGLLVMMGAAAWGLSNVADGAIRTDELHTLGRIIEDLKHQPDETIINNDHRWTTLATHFSGYIFRVPQSETMHPDYANYLIEERLGDYVTGAVWMVETPDIVRNDPERILSAWLVERSSITRHWTVNGYTLWQFNFNDDRAVTFYDLGPTATVPRTYAAPALDLVGVYVPIRRVEQWHEWTVALYWDTPPDAPFTVRLHGPNGATHTTEHAPPVRANGITRQQLIMPLDASVPLGAWTATLTLSDGRAAPLGRVWLVDERP